MEVPPVQHKHLVFSIVRLVSRRRQRNARIDRHVHGGPVARQTHDLRHGTWLVSACARKQDENRHQDLRPHARHGVDNTRPRGARKSDPTQDPRPTFTQKNRVEYVQTDSVTDASVYHTVETQPAFASTMRKLSPCNSAPCAIQNRRENRA